MQFLLFFPTKSVHETARRRGVDFGNDQASSSTRTAGRHMSIAHHGSLLDPQNTLADSASHDDDPTRMYVLNCLAPARIALAILSLQPSDTKNDC